MQGSQGGGGHLVLFNPHQKLLGTPEDAENNVSCPGRAALLLHPQLEQGFERRREWCHEA